MVLIIAEAGVNHNGDFPLAMQMIDRAVRCGADAIKFQIYDAEQLEPPGDRRDMLKAYQFSHEQFADLKKLCDANAIEFMASVFSPDDLAFLVSLGARRIKIGSGNLHYDALLEAASLSGKEIILSTGMATIQEVRHAVDVLGYVTLMHCVSAYPTKTEDANLNAITTLRQEFRCPVGYSDHTQSTLLPAVAVGMGAAVIEKHFTLDPSMDGPDHAASLGPIGFSEMVSNIRHVCLALGDGRKALRHCEMGTAIATAARRR